MGRIHSHKTMLLGFSELIWADTETEAEAVRDTGWMRCCSSYPLSAVCCATRERKMPFLFAFFDSHPIEMGLFSRLWSVHVSSTCLLCSQRIHQNYIHLYLQGDGREIKHSISFSFFSSSLSSISTSWSNHRFSLADDWSSSASEEVECACDVIWFHLVRRHSPCLTRTKWNYWIDESLSEEKRNTFPSSTLVKECSTHVSRIE